MTENLTVLIIGGYGIFGGRIVDLLQDEPRLRLIVSGRSIESATAFCVARPNAKAELLAAMIDRNGDVSSQLVLLKPDVVIDASGPFQAYGSNPYKIVEACIAHGISYLDLADGADFVSGVAAFDRAARSAGISVLSGVSSFPVLTAAVVRRLSAGMARVDVIHGGIAPSPYAGVGENVIRAIASYAGRPVALRRNGETATGFPFTDHQRFTIAVPGHVPLRNLLFSLVDVPDLLALPQLWPDVKSVWMGAGPVPEILHHALISLSWLIRIRLLPSLLPLAPLMYFVMNNLRWGEHRGGMFVVVEGVNAAGAPVARSWHLLAEGNDGPYIPSMAVEALVRRMLDGRNPAPGARAALCDLELDDYETLFNGRTIYSGIRETISETAQLYEKILGPVWQELPPQIQAMHGGITLARGRARVERGQGILARLVASIIGFPKAADDMPVTVRFDTARGVETWTRTFGADSFFSRQFIGRGRSDRLLCERFGPLTFAMALVWRDEKLSLILRRWNILGLPLPMFLCPQSTAYETVEDGRFHFHVSISHRLTGLIVRYQGWLASERRAL